MHRVGFCGGGEAMIRQSLKYEARAIWSLNLRDIQPTQFFKKTSSSNGFTEYYGIILHLEEKKKSTSRPHVAVAAAAAAYLIGSYCTT